MAAFPKRNERHFFVPSFMAAFPKRNERQIRLKNLHFGIKFITVHIDYYSIRIHLEIYSIHCIRKEFKSFIGLSNAAPESFKKTVS